MPITLAESKPDSIAMESTRTYPRTMLDAFPDDRAEYACALEGPRPRRGWSVSAIALAGMLGYVLLVVWGQ